MLGLTDFITESPWDDIAISAYVWVDDAYQIVAGYYGAFRSRGREPVVNDSEVITWALLCELLFHGDEGKLCHFLHQYMRHLFPHQLDRSQFNRRRRALSVFIEEIRRLWRSCLISSTEPVRIIDSAPVPVCTYTRSRRCQTVQGADYCGHAQSKAARFFGFRLHATVTPDQLIDEWLLAPASIHDVRVAPDLLAEDTGITVIGDAAYTSASLEASLWEDALLQLLPLRHPNQHLQWDKATRRILIRARMRVETAFSQLAVVLHGGLTGARSLIGVINRVASKILAHTFCYLWHRPAGHCT